MNKILKYLSQGQASPQKGGASVLLSDDVDANNSPVEEVGSTFLQPIVNKGSSNLNQYSKDIESFNEYGVLVNDEDTQEELYKERAVNQPVLEQTWRMLTQSVVNEIGLGMAINTLNLVEAAQEKIFKNKDDVNYTNEYIDKLEEYKDQFRSYQEIYQKDPSASFSFSDFGWWANNLVSVSSTLSMLIPSTAIMKGVGLVGKGLKINKALSKGTQALVKNVDTVTKINKGIGVVAGLGNTASGALLTRTMENYTEARQVYKEAYDSTLADINKMTKEEKDKFVANNPELANKTDEEMAKFIAGESADKTFETGYALTLIDAFQFKALGKIWSKGKGGGFLDDLADGKSVAKAQRKSLDKLAERVGNKVDDVAPSKLKTVGNWLKDNKGIFGMMAMEGFEEGFQGYAGQLGKEEAKGYMNPLYQAKDASDYFQDSTIWEQAFFGAIGGTAFQGMTKGVEKSQKVITNAINKNKLKNNIITQEQYENSKKTRNSIRALEIEQRDMLITDLMEDFKTINEGKKKTINKFTGIEEISDLSPDEVELAREEALNKFKVNMTINAANNGNFGLLKEYINDSNFQKLLANELGVDADFYKTMAEDMNKIYDSYAYELNNVLYNSDVANEYVAKAAAQNIIQNKLNIEKLRNTANDLDNKINSHNLGEEYSNTLTAVRKNITHRSLNEIINNADKIIANAQSELGKSVSKQGLEAIKREQEVVKNKARELLAQEFGLKNDENLLEESKKLIKAESELYKTHAENIDNSVLLKDYKSLQQSVHSRVLADLYDKYNPKNKQAYKELGDKYNRVLDRKTEKTLQDALTVIDDFIKQQTDIDQAKFDLYKGGDDLQSKYDLSNDDIKNLTKALELLKIGTKDSKMYEKVIDAYIAFHRESRIEGDKVFNGTEPVKRNDSINGDTVSDDTSSTGAAQEAVLIPEVIDTINDPHDNILNEVEPEISQAELDNIESAIETLSETIEDTYNVMEGIHSKMVDEAMAEENAQNNMIFQQVLEDQAMVHMERYELSLVQPLITNIINTYFTQYPVEVSSKIKSFLNGNNPNTAKDFLDSVVNYVLANKKIQDKLNQVLTEDLIRAGVIKTFNDSIKLINSKFTQGKDAKSLIDEFNEIHKDYARNRYAIGDIVTDDLAFYRANVMNVINKLLKEYLVNGKQVQNNSKFVIDFDDFMRSLFVDPDISYNDAIHIYEELVTYFTEVKNGADNNSDYQFKNIDEHVNGNVDVKAYFAGVRDSKFKFEADIAGLRVTFPTQAEGKKSALNSLNELDGKIKVTVFNTGGSLSFKLDDPTSPHHQTELGFLANAMYADGNNSSVRLQNQIEGFFSLLTNKNNVISDVFDGLFESLYNGELLNEINNYHVNGKLTDAEANVILNNNLIKQYVANGEKFNKNLPQNEKTELIKKGIIVIPKSFSTNKRKAEYIAKNLANIIYYDTQNFSIASYIAWKNKKYDNYVETINLQIKSADNKNFTISIDKVYSSNTDFKKSPDIDLDDSNFDLDTIELYGIVNNSIINGYDGSTIPTTQLYNGALGYKVGEANGEPIIKPFSVSNKISGEMETNLHTELVSLLESFQKGNMSYEEIGKKLVSLFNTHTSKVNSIFQGINVYYKDKVIILKEAGKTETLLAIFNPAVDKYDTKRRTVRHVNEEMYPKEQYPKGSFLSKPTFDAGFIHTVVKDIVSKVSYNKSMIGLVNENNTKSNNDYFYKNSNKEFVVDLGGKPIVYKSYAEFIFKNKAFKIKEVDKTAVPNPHLIISTGVETKISPDLIQPAKVEDDIDKQLDKLFAEGVTSVQSKSILELAGVDKNVIDNLTDNGLLLDTIHISGSQSKANGYMSNNKVYYTRRFIDDLLNNNKLTSKTKLKYLTSILAHENLHNKINKSGIDISNMIEDLSEVHTQLVKNLRKDINKGNAIADDAYKSMTKTIRRNGKNVTVEALLDIDSYGEVLSTTNLWKYANKEQQARIFYEEFLVESVTNPHVAAYMNSIILTDDNGNPVESKQTLLDWVLNLLKIIGIDLNKSSLLSKQLEIISNHANIVTTDAGSEIVNLSPPESIETTVEDENVSPVEESDEYIDFTNNSITEDADVIDDIDDLMVSISNLTDVELDNTNENDISFITTNNINEFIDSFPVQDRDNITKALNDGIISFVCQ